MSSLLDPHTKILSFCDQCFPSSWKDNALGYLSMDLKSFYMHPTQGEVKDSDGQVKHRSDLGFRVQAPSQLCSLLHFRFHHRLELRTAPRVLVLFLLHDLLLDLDSRLEVPHDLHRVRLMPPPASSAKSKANLRESPLPVA